MKVGLQMFTVRNSFRADPFGTLEKISALGYKYIEMANHRAELDPGAGFGAIPARELRKHAEDNGIKILGAHFMPSRPELIDSFYRDADAVQRVIDYYAEVGAPHLSLPVDFFASRDYLLNRCDLYNKIGRACKASGIQFLYHNHFHEFQVFGKEFMLDTIVTHTEPDLVRLELDAYWTFRGALNPVEKIKEYGKRIAILHEKDFPLDRIHELNAWLVLKQDVPVDSDAYHAFLNPAHFIEVGEGVIKVQDVIDAGNEFNIPYILVEQDHTKLDEFSSIALSMKNFRKMRGLEGLSASKSVPSAAA